MLLHLHEYMSMTNIYQLNFAEWYIKTCNHVDDVHVSELSVRFEVGVSLLLAPARADKRGPMAHFPLVENAGIQPAICKRVPVGAPAGAGSYASINSSGAHPPHGQLRGICSPCQSWGWGIRNLSQPQGLGISIPRGNPRAFDTRVFETQISLSGRMRPLSKTGLSIRG